jgi:serine/threonine protein kinase
LEAYCRHVQRHPNLIEISHVGIRGDLLYYTMELADDAISRKPIKAVITDTYRPLTLHRIIENGPVGVDTAMEVVLRLLRGLYRLHIVDLAHRDIKPANIIFVQRQPKIADVGMLTAAGATPSQVGTPQYMPPDRRMDLTADTYAMGRVLFELVFGAEQGDYPTPPEGSLPDTDTWDMARVVEVLARAGAANAAERYPRADLMYDDLEACRRIPYESLFSELDGAAETPARRRHPFAPLLLAAIHNLPWVLVLILAIILAWKLL